MVKRQGAGLRGQVARVRHPLQLGKKKGCYRGHKIETLAEKGTFEVAYLLLYSKLPNASELSDCKSLLKKFKRSP